MFLSITSTAVKPDEPAARVSPDAALEFQGAEFREQIVRRPPRAGGQIVERIRLGGRHFVLYAGQMRTRAPRFRALDPADLGEHVPNSLDQWRAILYKSVRSAVLPREHAPGYRQHVPTLLECHLRGDERPAVVRRLDDHDRQNESADDPIAQRKVRREGRCAG